MLRTWFLMATNLPMTSRVHKVTQFRKPREHLDYIFMITYCHHDIMKKDITF
jgi:hypothetical protein